jgi:sn-glycerol 3-phosphate transport system substrate-binding protein
MSRRTGRVRIGFGVVALAVLAACSSGESILNAGNETPDATVAPTAAPGDTLAPGATTSSSLPPTTTTTPLDTLPPCPVDALDDADGPVNITFWHGLNAETEQALIRLTDAYNASQSRVRVQLENQGGYEQTVDKYVQSGQGNLPEMAMFPEYMTQRIADSGTAIPIAACIAASGFDTSMFQASTLSAYSVAGVQWSMPFNVSNPVLYYNKQMFRDAGLDPEDPPRDLAELRAYSEQIVSSGAAAYGMAFDSGTDSGGGWFIEQWFANAGELYADNGNGRLAPATRVLYDNAKGVELLTFVQQMVTDGIAAYVGDNSTGQANFLKLADQSSPAAMTIGTSAALGTVLSVVDAGLIAGITRDDIGIGPMPGPSGTPTALVGGASLWIVDEKGDEKAAAVWDFVQYLVSAQSQSTFAVDTGYVPVRADALELDPARTEYSSDPRFRVAYDQLIGSPADPALQGPILGPQREVRSVTARAVADILNGGDVATALAAAAEQSNLLIADYAARN